MIRKNVALGSLVAALWLVMQYPVLLECDLDVLRKSLIILVGSLGFFFVTLNVVKLRSVGLLFVSIAAATGASFMRWVPGYTVYALAYFVFSVGVVMLVSECDVVPIFLALVAGTIAQVVINHFQLMPWGTNMPEGVEAALSYCSVRNRIRYGVILWSGIIGLWGLRKKWLMVPMLVLAVMIWKLNTQAVQAATVATLVVIVWDFFGKKAGLAMVAACIAGFVFLVDKRFFWPSDVYLTLWRNVINASKDAPLLGHGLGAYKLDSALFNENFVGHPHCLPLRLFYEMGIVGTLAALLPVYAVWRLYGKALTRTAMACLFFCCCTNSIAYPEYALLASLFVGMALKERDEVYKDDFCTCGRLWDCHCVQPDDV